MMSKESILIKHLIEINDWVKTDELSLFLNVSTRTIRSLIKNINVKKEYIRSSNKGYIINQKYLSEIQNLCNQTNDVYTSEIRQNYIIKQLLIENNSIPFYDTADDLYISESTLNNDLLNIKKKLEKRNVIISKKKDQIVLIGEEKNIRSLMADNIYGELDNELLTFQTLDQLFKNYDVQKIRNIIVASIIKNHLSVDDFSLIDITLHICIMLNRTENHLDTNDKIVNNIYTKITCEIFSEIEKLVHFKISDNEINNIAPLIAINTKQILDNSISINDLSKYVDKDIIDFVIMITNKIDELYGIQLKCNNFIIRFSLHLNKTLQVYQHSTRNPLLKNIKDSYPLIFDISVYIADLINRKYQIRLDDSEISYIALHVGLSIDRNTQIKINTVLVIPDYYSLKETIIENLNYNFYQKLNIINVYVTEEKIDYTQNIDLILSTVKIINHNNIQCLKITPFINDEDNSNIQYIIETILFKKKIIKNQHLYELFSEDCFTFIDYSRKEDIIHQLCSKAANNGYIDESFENLVLEREELSNTGFSNIAIPHTLNTTSFKTRILVGISHKPISWGINQINVVLLLVINSEDKDEFKNLFQNIISIFTSKMWNNNYRKITNFQEFTRLLKNSTQLLK